MDVVGTAFWVFGGWSLTALGLFVAFSLLNSLRGGDSVVPFIPVVAAITGWRRRAAIVMELAFLLAGCVLVVMGIWGVATVVL